MSLSLPWSFVKHPHAATLVAAVLLAGSAARATVVVVPTLEEMTLRADVVAQVVVRDQRVIDDKGRPMTLTSLEVSDGIKGAKAGDVIELRQLGGSVGGREMWIAGAHRFQIGEECVLFAMRPAVLAGGAILYGVGFGVFDVVDGVDGKKLQEITGAVVRAEPQADGTTKFLPVRPRAYDSLDAFKAELRAILDNRDLPSLPQKRILVPHPRKRG